LRTCILFEPLGHRWVGAQIALEKVMTEVAWRPKLLTTIRSERWGDKMAKKSKRGRPPARSMNNVDRQVAANIRRFRLERGLTQEALATLLGISFQQLQKYESAKNRITIGRLVSICEALKISLEEIVRRNG
jgi:DNA-binding Xre family transcriptional regulator